MQCSVICAMTISARGFHMLDPKLEFDHEVYPLGLLPNAGMVVGVCQRMSFSACTEFPCFEPSPQAQTILHCLLRHFLQFTERSPPIEEVIQSGVVSCFLQFLLREDFSQLQVGYIVGLGDRHSMNILIDQATAEVVHIDLVVAFEQGLMLKTPERDSAPFRLARDVVDGMGVTGVGVFRRCCEETLTVMRTNKEALPTIVEVFIYDPLYKWALER